jgi:glycosyltransferase involved in cell wall biosynthesis
MIESLKNDKVLIVITCFNHEKYVERTIRSVVNQTHQNIEIVVIDNASKDNSKAIIQKLALEFSFFKVILNETNLGVCKAVNIASTSSSADYFIDLAADDVLKPNYCYECLTAFQDLDETFGCVITRVFDIDENDIVIYKHDFNSTKTSNFESVLNGKTAPLISHFYRLKIFKELNGYDENLIFEDRDFTLRFAQKYNYFFLDKSLFGYRFLSQSLSKGYKTKKKMMDSYLEILQKLENTLKKPEHLEMLGNYAGRVGFRTFLMERFDLYPEVYAMQKKYAKTKPIHDLFMFLNKYQIRNFGFFNFLWKLNRSRKHLLYQLKHGCRNFNDLSE